MNRPRITPLPDSGPVNERVAGYPFSPFVDDLGRVWEWEPSGMGDPWPGVWAYAGQHSGLKPAQ